MKKIVVRLMPNHPTPQRNRAGFRFTTTPTEVEVNIEQYEAILNDTCLKIITRGTAFEQGQANPQKSRSKNEDEKNDTGNINSIDPNTGEKVLTKKQIITQLEAKGLKEGTDFNKSARNDILLQLLNS